MILNKKLIVVYTDETRPIVSEVASEHKRDLVEQLNPNAEISPLEEFVAEYGFDAGEENQYFKQSLRGTLEQFGQMLADLDRYQAADNDDV
jgi:hypothetical protein